MLNAALFVFDIYFVSVGSDNRRGRPFLTLWLREAVPARAKVGVAVDFKGRRGRRERKRVRKGGEEKKGIQRQRKRMGIEGRDSEEKKKEREWRERKRKKFRGKERGKEMEERRKNEFRRK